MPMAPSSTRIRLSKARLMISMRSEADVMLVWFPFVTRASYHKTPNAKSAEGEAF